MVAGTIILIGAILVVAAIVAGRDAAKAVRELGTLFPQYRWVIRTILIVWAGTAVVYTIYELSMIF